MTPDRSFVLLIELGNATMQAGPDVVRALRDVANRIEHDHEARGFIRDINGNTVGHWSANYPRAASPAP